MVNNPRKIAWAPPPSPLPADEKARRKSGPIYELAIVQTLVQIPDAIYVATRTCSQDLEKLEWDVDDVAKLIKSLLSSDYRHSEWCSGFGNIVLDADVYMVRYDHLECCRGNYQYAEYFVKFGFRNNDPKLTVFLFSCHLSRDK